MGKLTGHMVVMDIDGTQLREDIAKDAYSEADLADVSALNEFLEELIEEGAIVVHATNRMTHLYEADHDSDDSPGLLVRPHYATTTASTVVLACDRETGALSEDPGFNGQLEEIGYDEAKVRSDIQAYVDQGIMEWSPDSDQTHMKASAKFLPEVPVETREEVRQALQSQQADGVHVFMVEDPETHIIDIMPAICTKRSVIDIIAENEGIQRHNVFVAGNSNNDIPMFEVTRTGVAVSTATDSLKSHVTQMRDLFNGTAKTTKGDKRLMIAPEGKTPAQSVLWGLKERFQPILNAPEKVLAAE